MSDQNQAPEKDPVIHSSLSKPLFISSALLVVCTLWGVYDEVYATRPWKSYQKRFATLYAKYLLAQTVSQRDDTAHDLQAFPARLYVSNKGLINL